MVETVAPLRTRSQTSQHNSILTSARWHSVPVGNIYEPEPDTVERTRWYMDKNQIIEGATQLKLDRLLPTHYDMWRGVGADPTVLGHHAASYAYPRVIEHAVLGDRFSVAEPGRIQAQSLRK